MARVLQGGRYVRIALGDDVALRGLINRTVRSGDSGFKVFAYRIRRGSGSGGSGQNYIAENYQRNSEPHTPIFVPELTPEPEIYSNSPQSPPFIPLGLQSPPFIPHISVYGGPSFLPGPEPNPHPRPPPVQEDPNESEFEFMNEVPEENLQTGDEWKEGH